MSIPQIADASISFASDGTDAAILQLVDALKHSGEYRIEIEPSLAPGEFLSVILVQHTERSDNQPELEAIVALYDDDGRRLKDSAALEICALRLLRQIENGDRP